MRRAFRNEWFRLSVAVIFGSALGAAVALLAFPAQSQVASVGDRVMFTTGGTALITSWSSGFSVDPGDQLEMPLTAAEAVTAGWKDPVLCSSGRGKYFQRSKAGEDPPYFLMYDTDDEFIGIYLFSDTEMPAPWKRTDELLAGGSIAVVDHEHWGMFVYFTDPTSACAASDRTGMGITELTAAHAPASVRSYEAPPTPAPTTGRIAESQAPLVARI